MNETVHVKTAYLGLEPRELLGSPSDVLLGVSSAAQGTLAGIGITTVYDLALGAIFRDAARVVEAAADPASVIAKHGIAPADLIVAANPAAGLGALPEQPAESLVAVDAALGAKLAATMAVTTVRDLANWPPYLAAVQMLTSTLAPEKNPAYPIDAPPDITPSRRDLAAHQVRYTNTVLLESRPATQHVWDGGPIDVSSLSAVGFKDVALGAVMHYRQTWTPRAVSLGQLLHSLPLGPGESTRTTVVDWVRRVSASTEETQSQSEFLANAMSNSTAISEVTRATATEFQAGESTARSGSFSASLASPGLASVLGFSAAGGATFGTASTYSTSSGVRAINASAVQNISARTAQNAALSRSKRAAIVSEVSESESEQINTRIVINQNHMHAMSVQYYEVVQNWETETRLDVDRIERCIFIPMRLVNFANEQVVRRYLPILVATALDRVTRDLLLRFRHTVLLRMPFDRFDRAGVDTIRAQAQNAPAQQSTDEVPVAIFPFALSAAAEKRMRLQHLENQIGALRDAVRAQSDSLIAAHVAEDYDRVGFGAYEVDRDARITQVSWDPEQISSVALQLGDGTSTVLSNPADRGTGPVQGAPTWSLGQLASLTASVAAADKVNPSDLELLGLWVQLEVRGRLSWLNLGFVASRYRAFEQTVLRCESPVDLADLSGRLLAAQLYYSQQIWLRADRHSLLMQLAPFQYEIDGQQLNIVDWIDPSPITVAGNYVAFPFTYDDDQTWKDFVQKERAAAVPDVQMVPLPTGGVFAEAVLGSFNSAEKLDATRFWKWQESPIPNLAPQIAETAQGRAQRIGAPTPAALPPSVLSLQSPLAEPALGNSESLLKTLMVSKLFNDMSGADITKGLIKASLQASKEGNLAVQKQLNDTLKAVTDSFGKLLSTGTDGGENLTKTAKGLGGLFNLADKGDKPASTQGGGSAAGSAIDAGSAEGGASELGDWVVGDGAGALASISGELGPILDAIGPAAAALLA